jgi:MFS family permease
VSRTVRANDRGNPRPQSRVRASLRVSTAEGVFAELVTACAGATALTGWALHLGASPAEVAVIGALPQLATVVQLPSAWCTAALGRRRVAVAGVTLSRQALLPLALLPFLPAPAARVALVAIAALSAVLGVVANNAWAAWMGDLVPGRLRGRYFGRRTAICTLGGTLGALAAARLLDRASASGSQMLALAGLAVGASLLGAVTTALLLRQHDPPAPAAAAPSLVDMLRPFRDPDARGLLRYQLAWNAAVGVAGGIFTYHLLHDLRAGFTVTALHAASCATMRVAATPIWGRAVDRYGARPVMAACSFALAILPALWLFVTPDRLWPLAIDALIGGTAWGGHGIAAFALPLAVAPRRQRPFYLAAFAAAGGGAYALAAAAGGALVPALSAAGADAGQAVRLLFVISSAGRLASAFLALGIRERGAGTLLELHRAARGAAVGALAAVVGRRPAA